MERKQKNLLLPLQEKLGRCCSIVGIPWVFIMIFFIGTNVAANSGFAGSELSVITVQERTISGTVTDEDGELLPGVTIYVQGTTQGTVSNANGEYTLTNVPGSATLVFSFVGLRTVEVPVEDRTSIDVTMETETIGLEEVVAVGYGTQKKVNLTGSVSVADKEMIENRPVGNVQQALSGLVPNLTILPTNAGGEPGASMSMNIRGLESFEGSNNPYVLVDGIPMGINDVNPSDIESISVLKDAASTAIYGARAAYGVILITTKRGEEGITRATYSSSYSASQPTIYPQRADNLTAVHVYNESRFNFGGAAFYDDDAIERMKMNRDNPGSAPALVPQPNGLNWDVMNTGMKATGWTDWNDILLRDWAPQIKQDFSVSGGNNDINYYLSGSYYDESGLFKIANEYYNRYNVDAKIEAQATSWLNLSFLAKYRQDLEDFPGADWGGRGHFMEWTQKLKPGLPLYYEGTDIYTMESKMDLFANSRQISDNKQLVLSPRIKIEPLEGWVTMLELNYRQNNNDYSTQRINRRYVNPAGDIVMFDAPEQNWHQSNLYTNEYLSPNIYSTYTRSFGRHNIDLLGGYQQEVYNYNNLYGRAQYMLSENIPSINTTVGDKFLSDGVGHWATQSYFGRLNYNFDETYLFEANVRADGSSRFAEEERWGTFPSVSAGWVLTNEDFFPETNVIDVFKLRASYGTLGNQNVDNYLYIPTLGIRQTNQWLFHFDRPWTVGAPNLTSVNLTWEKVTTMDFGLDAMFLNNRLGLVFDWYESRTTDLVGPGEALPSVLGTGVPKKNEGEIMTRGFELELSWKHRVNSDFRYGFRGVLSDNTSTVVYYNNPNKLVYRYYNGQKLGEIWGYRTDGLFQTQQEIDNHHDQSHIWGGTWRTGDMKYVDLNDDGKINVGDNTVDDPGDREVIGNNTPRYIYGISGNATWKNFDVSVLVQGIGKRDAWVGYTPAFRGPAIGPMHSMVFEEHLDFFRDETSVLGANPDAYYARPYSQFYGENGKNIATNDHYLQDASFTRLKNVTIGYTLPASIAERTFIDNARIYIQGENILTFTDMMILDPEALGGRTWGGGTAYPLSKTYSLGLTVNF